MADEPVAGQEICGFIEVGCAQRGGENCADDGCCAPRHSRHHYNAALLHGYAVSCLGKIALRLRRRSRFGDRSSARRLLFPPSVGQGPSDRRCRLRGSASVGLCQITALLRGRYLHCRVCDGHAPMGCAVTARGL